MYRPTIIRRRFASPVTRASVLIFALVVSLSGAAFASLISTPGVLKGSSIQTAIASLQLSTDGNTYTKTLDGYSFGALVPGGNPSPLNGYPVYVKNGGTTPLALKLSVSSTVANPDTVDLNKVHVILSPMGGGAPQNMTLAALIAANTSGGIAITQASHMIPTQVTGFMIQVSLESDAVNGEGATINNLDFSFGGTAVN